MIKLILTLMQLNLLYFLSFLKFLKFLKANLYLLIFLNRRRSSKYVKHNYHFDNNFIFVINYAINRNNIQLFYIILIKYFI